jgi:hypothetical protein
MKGNSKYQSDVLKFIIPQLLSKKFPTTMHLLMIFEKVLHVIQFADTFR